MDLSKIKVVVSHDSCPDGLASAMIVKNVIHEVEYRFIQYNTPEHRALQPQPGVLFVDFSPNVGVGKDLDTGLLKAWGESGSIILDHHKTARHIVEAFGDNGRFGDESTEPGVCGAMLAYRHIYLPNSRRGSDMVERFARLAGVRDTWLRDSQDWEEACRQASILTFMPRDAWMSQSLNSHLEEWESKYSWIGTVLEDRHKKSVDKAIRGGYRFTSRGGTRVLMFDSLSLTSDACEALGNEVDLVVGYATFAEGGDLKTVYSTRAHGNFQCADLAKAHGGGGHTKAAGFSLPGIDGHPITRFQGILESFGK